MLLVRAWHSLATFIPAPLQLPFVSRNNASKLLATPTVTFAETWTVLGPFQVGTREAAWGSDPLEQYGGFRSLEHSLDASFPSSLAVNGTVSWSTTAAKLHEPDEFHSSARLDVAFPNIEWQALRDIYGWAAVQWQAWARGAITVHSDTVESICVNAPSLLEFWVDDVHFFGGDFYRYHRAPSILHLKPGVHRIDVRLVRDVRSMGGFGHPTVQAQVDLRVNQEPLHLHAGIMISDVVTDERSARLASPYVSATVRNDALVDIEILGLESAHNECVGEILAKVRLLPGQSRPIAFRIHCVGHLPGRSNFRIDQAIKYHVIGESVVRSFNVTADVPIRALEEPHKVTFLHPGGVVSYAILRPPSYRAERVQPSNSSLPVMLGLHGAGLEADNDVVRHSLDSLPDLSAWVVFPTGGSPWSGDDWHAWGLADVEAAVAMVACWIEWNKWNGSGVHLDKWLVSGHSNGGQGAWHILTHRPDNVIAAAVLSGYSSIQNYVPYTFWQVADPGRMSVVQAALSSYCHELLLPNAKGIPLLQQHGGLDDNVPVYHARLMSQQLHRAQGESEYYEFPDKPHFWEGCFVTEPLKDFYNRHILAANQTHVSSLSQFYDFSVVTANPGDTGPKHGIHILQLSSPGHLGRINVHLDPITLACVISTTNIRLFSLPSYFCNCSVIMLDDDRLSTDIFQHFKPSVVERIDGKWIASSELSTHSHSKLSRRGRQLGAMDAILRTEGTFQIVEHSNSSATQHIALQVSRNLCQYYAADTRITSSYAEAFSSTGNIISIATGADLPPGYTAKHPIQIEHGTDIVIRKQPANKRYTDPNNHGLAAIYLRPLPDGRLELVIWGIDAASLAVAARLVPLLPGTGQPDFVLLDKRMLWKGIEGALALGFYDSEWEISRASFFDG